MTNEFRELPRGPRFVEWLAGDGESYEQQSGLYYRHDGESYFTPIIGTTAEDAPGIAAAVVEYLEYLPLCKRQMIARVLNGTALICPHCGKDILWLQGNDTWAHLCSGKQEDTQHDEG